MVDEPNRRERDCEVVVFHHRRLNQPSRPLTPGVLRFLRIWFIIIPLVIMGVGGFFVVMGVNELQRALDSETWPVASGKVISSEVHEGWSSGGKGRSRHRTYTPEVKYEFTVEGQAYSSEKVNFRVRSEGQSAAQATVARYPLGAVIEVRYDPEDPNSCTLESGADWYSAIPIGVGLFSIAFCTFFMWMCSRWFRKAGEAMAVQAVEAAAVDPLLPR